MYVCVLHVHMYGWRERDFDYFSNISGEEGRGGHSPGRSRNLRRWGMSCDCYDANVQGQGAKHRPDE